MENTITKLSQNGEQSLDTSIAINVRPPALKKNTVQPNKYESASPTFHMPTVHSKYVPVSNSTIN